MDSSNKPLQGLFDLREACSYLGIRRSTLYKLISSGEIDSVHIGTRHLVPAETCHAYIRKLVNEQRRTDEWRE